MFSKLCYANSSYIGAKIRTIQSQPKILVLSGWYPNKRLPTEGDFVKHQIALLRNEGMTIDLVHCDLSIHNWSNLISPKKVISRSSKCVDIVHSKWFWPRNTFWTMTKWRANYVKEVLSYINRYGPPDMIHAHTYLGAWVGAEIKTKYNIPLIVTEHYTGIQDGTIGRLHNSIAKEAYANCDRIIAVSAALAKSIQERYQESTIVLPNFIDTQRFNLLTKIKTTSSVVKMVCVGDLIERKQLHLILYAMQNIEDVELTIIGIGPELQKLITLSKDLNISSQVTFMGQKSQMELSMLLPSFDMLVHASRLETFGLVLIEAMASGLPVVCFDNGGAYDILDESVGILVKEQTAEALTKAIQKMKINFENYNPQHIRQQVLDRFSPEVITRRLLQLYTEVIKEKNHKFDES